MIPEHLKTAIERDVKLLGDAYHVLAGYLAGEMNTATRYGITPDQAKVTFATYCEARTWMQECQIKRRAEASQTITQAKEVTA